MKKVRGSVFFFKTSLFLLKLLNFFGIKQQSKTKIQNKLNLTAVFYPFSIYMHIATFYNLVALLRCWVSDNSKSVFSSSFNSILSFTIWHVARMQGHAIHSLLKNCGLDPRCKIFSRKCSIILTMAALFVSFLFPIFYSFYFVLVVDFETSDILRFWFVANIPPIDKSLKNVLLFICICIYIYQQISFPAAFIVIFCVLNLKHVEKMDKIKFVLKNGIYHGISFLKQSHIHKEVLLKIRSHEEIFTFLIFLTICFLTSIGFTGLALLTKEGESQNFVTYEGIFYLYFSAVGIIAITYSASTVESQLQEIKEIYRMEYELRLEKNWLDLNDENKLKIIKMIYKRETPYLTAWKIVRLDKNLVFSILGGLLTYGFLILQLKKTY